MKFTRIRVSGMLATGIAVAIAGAIEVSAQAVDLSGAWTFTVTIDTGVTYPEVLLEQDGEKLTGRYSSDALGQSPVLGWVRGWEMTFSFSTEFEGQLFPVVYTGTVDEDGKISGTMDIGGGLLLGTFTAARSEHRRRSGSDVSPAP